MLNFIFTLIIVLSSSFQQEPILTYIPNVLRPIDITNDEKSLLNLILNDEKQQRDVEQIMIDYRLVQVGRSYACTMAYNSYFGHVDLQGNGPNRRVINSGIDLPDYYSKSKTANNIESIGAGFETAEEMYSAFLKSNFHRKHILGQNSFFREQNNIGVGHCYLPESTYKNYWVVLSYKSP